MFWLLIDADFVLKLPFSKVYDTNVYKEFAKYYSIEDLDEPSLSILLHTEHELRQILLKRSLFLDTQNVEVMQMLFK